MNFQRKSGNENPSWKSGLFFWMQLFSSKLTALAFLAYSFNFFAFSGNVRLRSTSMDCKQRSSTVSKEAPTVGKNIPPFHTFRCSLTVRKSRWGLANGGLHLREKQATKILPGKPGLFTPSDAPPPKDVGTGPNFIHPPPPHP